MGLRIHFVARERHFVDHLAPVWSLLQGVQGWFWVPWRLRRYAARQGIERLRTFGRPAEALEMRLIPQAVARMVLARRSGLARVGPPRIVLERLLVPSRAGRLRLLLRQRVVDRLVPVRFLTTELRHEVRMRRVLVRRPGITMLSIPPREPVVTASLGDLRSVADGRRPLALFEHGMGQSYSNSHPSFSGGRGNARAQVGLFAVPNELAARRNRLSHPRALTVVVGTPRLDRWHRQRRPAGKRRPVVAISFHWESKVAPEARGAFSHFRTALEPLRRRFEVLGHGHPRIFPRLEREYRRLGIEPVRNFEEVLRRADVYVTDNSSTLYEFASTDRPVVVLNAPWYRRHVHHGLRFWEYADVGVQCNRPEDLVAAVDRALADPRERQTRRRRVVQQVVPYRDGQCARRAALAILRWLAA